MSMPKMGQYTVHFICILKSLHLALCLPLDGRFHPYRVCIIITENEEYF